MPLRHRIVAAGQGQALTALEWLNLAESITEAQAEAALACRIPMAMHPSSAVMARPCGIDHLQN